MTRTGAAVVAVVTALSVILYVPAVRAGWVWDDEMLIHPSPALRDLSGLWRSISTDLYRQADPRLEESAYWRPVALGSLWLNSRLGDLPRSLHAGNVLLHAIAAALLTIIILRRSGKASLVWPAGIAATWWVLHPENVEVVAWISCRYELLACVALLVLLAVPWRPGPRRAALYGLIFLAGLLSKDGFAPFALVVIADDWAEKRPCRSAGPRQIAIAAAIAAWLVLRAAVGIRGFDVPDWLALPRLLLDATGTYAIRSVSPLPLTITHPHELSAGATMAGAAVLAALGATVLAWRHVAVGAAVFVAGLVPAAVAMGNFGEAPERYFYLPSVGLALLLGDALAATATLRNRVVRSLAVFCALALTMLGLPAVVARIPDWRSDGSLFESALRVDPSDAQANLNLGAAALRTGDLDVARRALEVAQRSDPRSGRIAAALASVLLQMDAGPDALHQAIRVTRVAPTQPDGWFYLGMARHRAGDHRGELHALQEALRLSPAYPSAAAALEVAACETMGRVDCGQSEFDRKAR